jgi:hypothetical protein
MSRSRRPASSRRSRTPRWSVCRYRLIEGDTCTALRQRSGAEAKDDGGCGCRVAAPRPANAGSSGLTCGIGGDRRCTPAAAALACVLRGVSQLVEPRARCKPLFTAAIVVPRITWRSRVRAREDTLAVPALDPDTP